MLRHSSALFLLAAVWCLSCAAASPLFESYDTDQEAGEERLLFSSNGGFSLTNSTVDLGALLTAALLGLLFAITLGPQFFGASSGAGGYGYSQNAYGYNSNNFYARSDQNLHGNDLATQMFQLAQAFKKYEVEDQNCQLYVACEASQENRHEQNGYLAKTVFGVMTKMNKQGREAVQAKDEYVAQLLDAFRYGQENYYAEKYDSCHKLKNQCLPAGKAKAPNAPVY